MFALISPTESVHDHNGVLLGARVAEVLAEEFPIASPLFWMACEPGVVADQYYWLDGSIFPIPVPPPPTEQPAAASDGPTVL